MGTYSPPNNSDKTTHRVVLGYPSMPEYVYNSKPPPPPPPPIFFQPPQSAFVNTYGHLGYEHARSISFARLMLGLFIVLLTAMCLMSLIIWFLFGTYVPEFSVRCLKVSNFSATNTTFQGLWDTNMSILNANEELHVRFEHVRSLIMYKGIILGMSRAQTIEVEKKQTVNANFSVLAGEVKMIDSDMVGWGLPSLMSDWNHGTIDFGVRLTMNANFSSRTGLYRNEGMRVFCDDVGVEFSSNGDGASKEGLPNRCTIRMHDSLD